MTAHCVDKASAVRMQVPLLLHADACPNSGPHQITHDSHPFQQPSILAALTVWSREADATRSSLGWNCAHIT